MERRNLMNYVVLDKDTQEPIFDEQTSDKRNNTLGQRQPASPGPNHGSQRRGKSTSNFINQAGEPIPLAMNTSNPASRELQQTGEAGDTQPFTNLISGIGAFMAPARELVSRLSHVFWKSVRKHDSPFGC